MEQYFLLTFGTALGSSRTLRINHINPAVTGPVISNAMANMIASGALTSSKGAVVVPRQAVMIGKTVTGVNIAPFV